MLGQPFYVMDRVDGVIPSDHPPFTHGGWLFDATPAQQGRARRRSALTVLAELHKLDWREARLRVPRASRVRRDAVRAAARLLHDDARAGRRPDARCRSSTRRSPGSSQHRPAHEPAPSLTWGDARIGNMIFRDFRPVAVLDWEMVTLGPGEVDLAWWLVLDRYHTEGVGAQPLPGFPEARAGRRAMGGDRRTARAGSLLLRGVGRVPLRARPDPHRRSDDRVRRHAGGLGLRAQQSGDADAGGDAGAPAAELKKNRRALGEPSARR